MLSTGPTPSSYNTRWPSGLSFTVSVLRQDKGYTVKYSPLSEAVAKGEAPGNS